MTSLFLDEDEIRQLLVEWNDTALEYPAKAVVHELAAARARAAPDDTAVVSGERRTTYRELDDRANRLAHYLIGLGAAAERRVVLYLERTADIPEAVLGVLKSGAAYVPLDAGQAHRLEYALEDAVAVLTTEALRGELPDTDVPVITLDDPPPELSATSTDDPGVAVAPSSLACLIYTSGSTGRPKGVMLNHANLAAMYHSWERAYDLPALHAHCQMANFSFVVFHADLVRALCSGATLVICPLETVLTPELLYRTMVEEKVDFAEFVPAVLRPLLRYVESAGASLDFLRLVAVGSDRWLYGEHAELRRLCGPDTTVVHSFGLTECTVDSARFTGTTTTISEGQLTPIGRPFPNVRLYILDEEMRPVPVGVTGELYIGGAGVTRGYAGDPELTAQRFVPDAFGAGGGRLYRTGDLARYLGDGNVQFLGRGDGQVKVRGFRVELGEIESVLRAHPGVKDAAVTSIDTGAADDGALAAFVIPAAQPLGEGEHRIVTLPDGTDVASVNDAETHQFFQEISVDGLYFRHGVTVEPGDVVVDVGANIGMFSLCAAARARDIEIYAFEPIPSAFRALSVNAGLHGLNARLFACGLAANPGSTRFTLYPRSVGMSSRYADAEEERAVLKAIMANQYREADLGGEEDDDYVDEWLSDRVEGEAVDCELRTLSDVIDEQGLEHVDLLKVVVQKSEWDVLMGVREEHWPRIRGLVAEVYDIDGRVDRMRDFLAGRGFTVAIEQAPLFAGSVVHLMYAVRPRSDGDRAAGARRARDVATPVISAKGLHEHLRGELADYMVPSRFAFLEALPLTSTGKVARQALPEEDLVTVGSSAEYVAPRTEVEKVLAAIWAELLGREQVGVRDDFFELGGHSLLATQMIARTRRTWQVDLPLRTFLRTHTIEDLAAEIQRRMA